MPNGTQDAVPSTSPPVLGTPPFLPRPGEADPGGVDAQTKRILAALTQAATQRRAAGAPRPYAVPGQTNPFQAPAYMTSGANPHAWGAQRLMYGVQSMIGNAVSRMKEQQITKATADWEYAQSALNEYYAAQQSGDEAALKTAQGKLDVVFGDPKKLKQMAKALNQDWLNPEKTTVHGEALKRVAAQTQQKDQQKQGAKAGLQDIFKKLIGRGQQQPQYTDEERQKMEQEIINKAPTTTGGVPSPEFLSTVRTVADFEKAANAARAHYQVRQAADGSFEAFNPLAPQDPAIPLRDQSGNMVMGKPAPKEGTLVTVGGMPQGVFHGGKAVYPGDAQWTDRDQKIFERGAVSVKEKQFLRVDPALAAIVGDPPDPTEFSKGRSDPAYGKALKDWGQEVFNKEVAKAEATGVARAKAFNQYRPVEVLGHDDQGNPITYYTTAKQAIEEGLASAAQGIKLESKDAQINDIAFASGKMRDAVNNIDKPFDAAQIAKLQLALTTGDEGVARTELSAAMAASLTDKQQDYVVWLQQINERAMALRQVAGFGSSAQDLRGAIRDTLPGLASGNKQMALKKLDAFDNQVAILKKGLARPGKPKAEDQKPRVISLD